jgi:hypothetical protein
MKPYYQNKSETDWTVPPALTSSLHDIQDLGERQAEGENKIAIDNVQKLIRVRSGPLFISIFCVQQPSLFYLGSF